MFLHVIKVVYLGEYTLRLTFNNGAVKDVNLREELYGEVFEPLKDQSLFQRVKLNPDTRTIEWPNGADLAPEFLYEVGREVKKVAPAPTWQAVEIATP
jgi:hypothetical protein